MPSLRGSYQIIYPSTTIPGTAAVAMTAFKAEGNSVEINLTTTVNGVLSLTFTAERAPNGSDYGAVIDENSAWSMVVTTPTTAGTYTFELKGLVTSPGEMVRLSYTAQAASGKLAVAALSWDNPAGDNTVEADVSADMGTIDTSTAASAASLAIIEANLPSLSTFVQECEDNTEFAAVLDAQNLADDTEHVTGTVSVEWDKTGGSNVISGVDDTITSLDLSAFSPSDYVSACFYIPSLTDVAKVHIQIGTDNANYTEWEWADTVLSTGWNFLSARLTDYTSIAGTGMQQAAVTYVQAAVEFDLAADTLNDMKVDHIAFVTAEALNDPSTAAIVALLTTIDADTSILAAAADIAVDPQTGVGAIAYTTTITTAFQLTSITLVLDIAGTTTEDLTIDLDAIDGVTYDANLLTLDLEVDAIVDLVLTPEQDGLPKYYEAGDELAFAWPNTEGRTWTLRVVVKGV